MSIETDEPRGDVAAPPSRPARRLRTAIPLVIVLVLLAELAIRAAAPKLRDPLLWPDWEAAHKVTAMDQLAASRGGASVVFVGSSMVNAGFSAELATQLLGGSRPVFNAALNGSDLRMTDVWTRGVVVPRLHPKVVVLGFNSGELNDHWQAPTSLITKMLQSPYGKRAAGVGGPLATIDASLMDRSYLMRYRSVLRSPWDALVGTDKAEKNQRVGRLGRFLALRNFQKRPYSPGLATMLGVWDGVFRNYRPGGVQFAALDRLVSFLTERKIRVVLVRMPVTKDIIPLMPRGVADRERFGRAIAGFVSSHPVTFIDAESAIGASTDLFVDPLHLNTTGAVRCTTLVVDDLRRLG